MNNPVQINLRGIAHSDALEQYIGEEARKLGLIYERIVRCHVIAEKVHAPKRQKAHFAVRLNLTLPGIEVAVDRDHGEDIYMAVRSAFEAAARQLKNHMSRLGSSEHRLRNGKANPGR